MNSHNVRSAEDARSDRRRRAPHPLTGGYGLASWSKGLSNNAFARSAHQERIAERSKFWELCQQLVVLRKTFSEAYAGVENDSVFFNAGPASDANGFF